MSLSTKAGGALPPTVATVQGLQAALDARTPTTRSIAVAGLATGGGDLGANRTITVPAASQAEAEAGTNNTHAMTPLRVAQAIDALGGGGAVFPGVAYVFAATGHNATAVVGDASKPFATVQGAYDAGARTFYVIGSVGGLSGTDGNLSFIGVGCEASVVSYADVVTSVAATVVGNGASMITVGNILLHAPPGASGANGSDTGGPGEAGTSGMNAAPATVRGMRITGGVLLQGGAGGNGGSGNSGDGDVISGGNGGSAGNGGYGSSLTICDCDVGGLVISQAGSGGSGGSGGSSGGESPSGGAGGNGGSGGMGGSMTLVRSRAGAIELAGGGAGSGGAGGGSWGPTAPDGTEGSIGSVGTYHATFSEIGSISSGDPGTMCANVVGGVFHASGP